MQVNSATANSHGGEITSKLFDRQRRYYFIMFEGGPVVKNMSICHRVVVAMVCVW